MRPAETISRFNKIQVHFLSKADQDINSFDF